MNGQIDTTHVNGNLLCIYFQQNFFYFSFSIFLSKLDANEQLTHLLTFVCLVNIMLPAFDYMLVNNEELKF